MGSFTGTAIDRLRLEAKRLLKDIRRGDAAALQRFTTYWPASGPSGEVRNLSRTQLVIARERGYRSWAHLKTSLLLKEDTAMETQISSPITLDAETARVMAENDDGSIHLERIETLNVETARALAGAKMWSGKLPRLTSLSVETARALAQFKGTNLSLDGLTSIDVDTARALAGFTTHPEEDADGSGQKFRGVWLGLNGLETLDAATAKALTAFKGEHTYLYLKGLKSLSVDAAQALGEFEGNELHLGLPKLTGDLAAAMAAFKCGRLYFKKLTGIDAATAASLAAYRGRGLTLGALEGLSVEAARVLAGFKGRDLCFNGSRLVSTDVADAIADFKGQWLWLSDLTTLSAPEARSLARFKGRLLGIETLPAITTEAAQALAKFQGDDLILDGLTTLDDETAQALAAFKGNVRLFGLTRLSIETARMVYERYPQKEFGRYIGITALDTPDAEQVARFLAGCEGELKLPRLEKISPKALNALLQKKDIILPPINSLELIPEPDGSPTVKVVIPEGYFERQKKEKRKRIMCIP
jgi:hypothetical protein